MFTSPMKYLTAFIVMNDAEKVTKKLLRLGVMDFVKVSEMPNINDPRLTELRKDDSYTRIEENRRRIKVLLESSEITLDSTTPLDITFMKPPNLEKIEESLKKIAEEIQTVRDEQRDIQQEILRLEDIQRQIFLYSDLREGLHNESVYSFLVIKAGSVPESSHEELLSKLKPFLSVQLKLNKSDSTINPDKSKPNRKDRRISLINIYLKKDANSIKQIMESQGWREADISTLKSIPNDLTLQGIKDKINDAQKKQDELSIHYKDIIFSNQEWLKKTWNNLTLNTLYFRVQSYFSRTERTVLFSGWVPLDKQREVESGIKSTVNAKCILEWKAPEEVEAESNARIRIPVRLTNPHFLKPFEMLVNNYSVPEYGTIDPTPFVAVAFLMMFGLMFNDAGHGLVLLILGALAPRLFKNAKDSMKRLFTLIMYCGGASTIMGILFGTYFGYPLFPPLWFNYHALVAGENSGNPGFKSIYNILVITIYFGIAVIGVGLVLNWINLLKNREWFKLLYEKGGIIGAEMYFAGVYTGFYFAEHAYKELPGNNFLLFAFGIPLLLLMSKIPVAMIRNHKKSVISYGSNHPTPNIIDYIMDWIVELLEIFSGYLANTLSFMRVAGLGIAHVSLLIAFRSIAHLTGSEFSIAGLSILLLGNILVIILEGLSAGVQALRLSYYEFFSKYFIGNGRAYAPISLRNYLQEEG